MRIEHKYALLMDMPEDKRPGFYAQVVKALANKAPLFDRDKEMLIFSSPTEREAAYAVMEQYKIPFETMNLLMLPDGANLRPPFSDFGFVSRSEHAYIDSESVYVFSLHSERADAEPSQALAQLEEHLLASYGHDETDYYVTDAPSDELVHRIAQAYRCEARHAAG
ncbi:hypothetical protein [Paenibacillus xerothermodurans]|uniref:Uncharacterized protein n=1 Tax=Paenibacillus xerothermodurans TaxID=1977292 RepID=A0A2W1NG56_PAEXE|nr:hypothetical protein [Paenibacillus xerothermodurans]PZE22670.1 hypothetical protein CBW46_002565 [Paenibacillus xerothermodurans]